MKPKYSVLIILALFLAGALGTQTSYARKPAPMAAPSVKPVVTQVQESIQYPKFAMTKEDHDPINVTFMLTDEGDIQIEKISAPNEKMEQYVRDQLAKVNLKNVIHPYNQLYKMTLKFSVAG
jgi:hypothetical protein